MTKVSSFCQQNEAVYAHSLFFYEKTRILVVVSVLESKALY